jgi:hypothetical protein
MPQIAEAQALLEQLALNSAPTVEGGTTQG